MNDFLGQLIERERGAAGAVAPRLPSFYEPRSDAFPAETAEGETTGETVGTEITRRAPQRHDPSPSAEEEPTGQRRIVRADNTASVGRIVEQVFRPAPQAARPPDTISPAQTHFVMSPPTEHASPADVDSRKHERTTPRLSGALPPSHDSAGGAVAPVNEPEQSPEQVRAPAIGASRLAPRATDPPAPVQALVPEPSPRRALAQSPAPPADAAEPVRPPVGPLPVTPAIAITHQTGDRVSALPTGALAPTPPNLGEIAPAAVPHTGDAAPSRDRDAPAPVPTIHVTIGRVEVRAVQAPARDARPVRASEQPMSLDEYLRRRGQREQA
jgi:hypothetical protein